MNNYHFYDDNSQYESIIFQSLIGNIMKAKNNKGELIFRNDTKTKLKCGHLFNKFALLIKNVTVDIS
jgi:hypothetical protein